MKMISGNQIKAIWASAREYGVDKQSVYDIIEAVSGKEHMRDLSYSEAAQVLDRIKGKLKVSTQKRTDVGGKEATVNQRRKIYVLTGKLGWNDNHARINGMAKYMFGIERIEWLNVRQCSALITALNAIITRNEAAAKECLSEQGKEVYKDDQQSSFGFYEGQL